VPDFDQVRAPTAHALIGLSKSGFFLGFSTKFSKEPFDSDSVLLYTIFNITRGDTIMDQFFAKDFAGGEFAFMGITHLIALLSIVLLNFYLLRYKTSSEATRNKIRWTMAIVLWVNELGWHLWNASVGQWNIQTMLPFHVCSALVWLGGVMLVTKNYAIYEFAYFMGIAGALQALLTPDLGIYGFPHYRFFQTFVSHGLIVTSAMST
jgi:uncharacterized membrane protein YwaF